MARKSSGTLSTNMSSSNSPFSFLSLFGFHHVNKCENDDGDFYCSFMRIFQLIVAFVMLAVILYLVYFFAIMPFMMKRGSKRG